MSKFPPYQNDPSFTPNLAYPIGFVVVGFVLLVAGVLASLGTAQAGEGFTIYTALIFGGIASVVYGIMGIARA